MAMPCPYRGTDIGASYLHLATPRILLFKPFGVLELTLAMQNTRLNNLVDAALSRSTQWLQNPWRRISLVVISLLLGNALATAIATTTGQNADWDIVISAILVAFTEGVSWIVYRKNGAQLSRLGQRSLVIEISNALKLGLMYGLFVEAFKIGS